MVKTKKTEPTQEPSPALEDIVEQYNTWKREVKSAQGKKIGNPSKSAAGQRSLWAFLMQPSGFKSYDKNIRTVDRLVKKDNITLSDMAEIKKVIDALKKIDEDGNEGKNNPRNMPKTLFEVFEGKKTDKKIPYYGFWLTKDYLATWKKLNPNKDASGLESVLAHIGDDWASDSVGTAKPPMWQALFMGEDKSNKPVVTLGLLPILKKYYDEIQNLELTDVKITTKQEEEAIAKLSGVEKVVKDLIGNSQNYRAKTNFLNGSRAVNFLRTRIIHVKENEQEMVKNAIKTEMAGVVKSVILSNISVARMYNFIYLVMGDEINNFKTPTLGGKLGSKAGKGKAGRFELKSEESEKLTWFDLVKVQR
tara:strand:- start:937 stop:2025 length:1089 start_codon:yes stop_codon:yes gene_type:complete